MAGQLSPLTQLPAYHLSGTGLAFPTGPFPIQRYAPGNEPIHRLGHIAEPGTAAHFAIRADIYSGLALMPERIANRIVFNRAELFQNKPPLIAFSPRGEEFGRAQQTADLIGANLWFHRVTPGRLHYVHTN